MILNHRVDAMGIARSAVHIVAVTIEVFKSHHAVVHGFIEHICRYILAVAVVGTRQVVVAIQTALAERGGEEQVLVDVVLNTSHQSHGVGSQQIACIAVGDKVVSRTTQIVQVIGIAFTVCRLIIELPMR